jgi:glycosyltransferase involved in cell wall biosynthesis
VPGDSRPRALATALGGEARTFFDLGIVSRPLVPVRYLLSAARTLAYLARRRPSGVIVQAPPVPAALIAFAYGRLAGVPVVVDSHPAAFALERARPDRLMLPLLRWLAPRVSALIVTTPDLARRVREWGGRPLIVHEPPSPAARVAERPDGVLFVSTFAPDEPLEEVLEAARALPDVRFRITGDPRRKPDVAAPPNVEWTGFLRGEDYWRMLGRSAVILSLTRREQAVLRSSYEAVYALRPLIASDWPHMRELFPQATHASNHGAGIAAAVRGVLERRAELEAAAAPARELQLARWEQQLAGLRDALEGRP